MRPRGYAIHTSPNWWLLMTQDFRHFLLLSSGENSRTVLLFRACNDSAVRSLFAHSSYSVAQISCHESDRHCTSSLRLPGPQLWVFAHIHAQIGFYQSEHAVPPICAFGGINNHILWFIISLSCTLDIFYYLHQTPCRFICSSVTSAGDWRRSGKSSLLCLRHI